MVQAQWCGAAREGDNRISITRRSRQGLSYRSWKRLDRNRTPDFNPPIARSFLDSPSLEYLGRIEPGNSPRPLCGVDGFAHDQVAWRTSPDEIDMLPSFAVAGARRLVSVSRIVRNLDERRAVEYAFAIVPHSQKDCSIGRPNGAPRPADISQGSAKHRKKVSVIQVVSWCDNSKRLNRRRSSGSVTPQVQLPSGPRRALPYREAMGPALLAATPR